MRQRTELGVDQTRKVPESIWNLPIRTDRMWVTGGEDFEAEHDGREPSLGAPERKFAGACGSSFSQERWGQGTPDDREGDGADQEPELVIEN
jgi:hypothetical protein